MYSARGHICGTAIQIGLVFTHALKHPVRISLARDYIGKNKWNLFMDVSFKRTVVINFGFRHNETLQAGTCLVYLLIKLPVGVYLNGRCYSHSLDAVSWT